MRWNRSRTDAAKIAEEAMQKPPEKIVEDLYADFYNAETPAVDGHKTGLILSHHAALLAAIAKKDSETAEKNLRIQGRLILLTVIILVLTFFSAIGPAFQVYQYFHAKSNGASNEEALNPKHK